MRFCDIYSSSLSSNWFTKFNVTILSSQIWWIFDFSNNAATWHYWNTSVRHMLCYSASTMFLLMLSTWTILLDIHYISLMLNTWRLFTQHLKVTWHTLNSKLSRLQLRIFLGWTSLLITYRWTQLSFAIDLVTTYTYNVSKFFHPLCLRVCHQYTISSMS